MKDGNETPRLVMGFNPTEGEHGKYQFELSNAAGVETMTLDSNGNAVFKGKITASDIEGGTIKGARIESGSTIDVETDLTVGENIYLTSEDDEETGTTKKIQFFDSPYGNYRAKIEAERADDDWVELIEAGKIKISTPGGFVNSSNQSYLAANGVSGSFATADSKTITVVDGLITNIS